jgi:hypothetical protein
MTTPADEFDWQLVERVARLGPGQPSELGDTSVAKPSASDLPDPFEVEPWEEPVELLKTVQATEELHDVPATSESASAPCDAVQEAEPAPEPSESASAASDAVLEAEPAPEPSESASAASDAVLEAEPAPQPSESASAPSEATCAAAEVASEAAPVMEPLAADEVEPADLHEDDLGAEPAPGAVVAAYEARLGAGPLPALLSDIRDENRRINHVLASAGAVLDDGQVAMVRLALRPAPSFGEQLDARLREFEGDEPARRFASGPLPAAAARVARATARLFVKPSGQTSRRAARTPEPRRPKVIRGSAEERLQRAVRRKLDDGPWFEAALRVLVADDTNVAPLLRQLNDLEVQLDDAGHSSEAKQLKAAANLCRRQLDNIERACDAKARALTESFAPFYDTTQRLQWKAVNGADAAQGLMSPPSRRPKLVLSAREAAQLAHVADDLTEDTTGVIVERSTFKHLPVRRPLYVDDPLRPADGLIPIGQQDGRAIAMPNSRLDRHAVIAGRSGTGKSELLLRMCLGMAHAGYPIVVIDPHGQLCDDLMNIFVMHCPERVADITYVDVGSYPVGINPLDVATEEEIQAAVDATLLIMRDKFQLGSQAPRAVSVLEAALYALAEANVRLAGRTDHRLNILDLLDFFSRDPFRALVMQTCANRASAEWFDPVRGRFENLSQKDRDDHTGAIVRGLTRIAANPTFSLPFSASRNKLDFSQLMTGRRIVLLKLARFSTQKAMGEMVASFVLPALLGSMAKWARNPGLGQATGVGARVIVDEAHAVIADDPNIESTLAEARKYDVGAILATQYIGQMAPSTQDAILVNTASKFAFANDPTEVSRLAASIAGNSSTPSGRDISGLPNYHYFGTALLQDASGPFSTRALEPVLKRTDDGRIIGKTSVHQSQIEAVADMSQVTIGTTREHAEQHQREHLRALEAALQLLRSPPLSNEPFAEPESDQDFWGQIDRRR